MAVGPGVEGSEAEEWVSVAWALDLESTRLR